MVFFVLGGIPPKKAVSSGLGIIEICPDNSLTNVGYFEPPIFGSRFGSGKSRTFQGNLPGPPNTI